MASAYIQNLEFKIKVYDASGNAYQSLFSKVMAHAYENFMNISVYRGDGGNDGFIPSQNWYFQVYAPEIISGENVWKKAASKIKNDFLKLLENWHEVCNVKKYSFVCNDRFRGIPSNVQIEIGNLNKEHRLIEIEGFSSSNLHSHFLRLDEGQKSDIVGFCPELDGQSLVNYDALSKILFYLVESNRGSWMFDSSVTAPELLEKLQFNRLSQQISDMIKCKSRESSLIDNYFIKNPNDSQAIAMRLHNLYEESKNLIPDSDADAQDLRYFWIKKRMLPQNISRDLENDNIKAHAFSDAADIIMAKYVESCDVYEPPVSVDSK